MKERTTRIPPYMSVRRAGEEGAVVLDVSPHRAEAAEEENMDEEDGGDENRDCNGEFPVDEEEDQDDTDDAKECGVGDDHGVVDAAHDLIDVGHDAGDDAAGFVVGEFGEGEADKVVVEALAEGAGEAVIDALGGEKLDPVKDDLNRGDEDKGDGDGLERASGGGGEEIVEAGVGEQGHVAEAFVFGDVIDEDFEDEGDGHGGERRAGDGDEEGDHRFGVAAEHDAVFGEELFLLAFEDVFAGGGGGVAAAGVGGFFGFAAGVAVARGFEDTFADLLTKLRETLATGLHSR